VSESSWLAVFTSGDSDVGDFTATFEQLSKAGFTGRVAEVSDEDLSGRFGLSGGTGSSLFLGFSLFDGQLSAFELVAVEGQSLLEGFSRVELDESNTLGSAVGASQKVNFLDSAATLEESFNCVLVSGERKVSNENFIGWFGNIGAGLERLRNNKEGGYLSLFVSVLHV
jgi:hypothetical protein